MNTISNVCLKNKRVLIRVDFNVPLDENLVILSSSAINIKDLSKEFLNNLQKETEEMLTKENINDQDRYILNHKIDVIKEIRV